MHECKWTCNMHNYQLEFIQITHANTSTNWNKILFIKGFCQNISKPISCRNKFKFNNSLKNIITNKMMFYINMLCSRVCMGFLEILMALVLSHLIGTFENIILKSKICCLIHKIWATQLPATTYLDSAVDNATQFCLFLRTKTLVSCLRIDKYPKCFSV